MRKPLYCSPFFNEIAGINYRLASLVKKSLHQRHLKIVRHLRHLRTCEYIRTFNASTERSYVSSVFFIKLRAAYYKVATLLRSWSIMNFSLKRFFFKTASFRHIFQKISVMSYLNSKVAV